MIRELRPSRLPDFKKSFILSMGVCCLLSLMPTVQAFPGKKDKDKAKSSDEVEVKNFGKVNDHLFRGAQPDESEYGQLAAKGIKTVIDLREEAKGKARRLAEDAGMNYIHLRLDSKVPPTAEESKLFLSFVNDPANWPVYVHCAGGRHRTGVLIAVYRMEMDGWDAEKAYGEMRDYKFYSSWGHGDMKDYVFDYFRRMTETRARNAAAPINRPYRDSDARK